MFRTMMLLASGLLGLCLSAHAANYGAGNCQFPNTQMFPTIQAAVNAVPPGATISVCPGVYAEQVTITKPIVLQGRPFGNANRAVVAVPPGGLSPNITYDDWSFPTFAQILVQNVTPPGPVSITGITVDGIGAADINGTPLCTTGIFYAAGTSGTVNEVTTRNQIGFTPGQYNFDCGYGIWAENEPGPDQAVTIENSSVHDFGWAGITTYTRDDNPTLNATIYANFVTGSPVVTGIASDANSSVANNFVTGSTGDGINVRPPGGFGPGGSASIIGNTVADVPQGAAINSAGTSTIALNRVSNAQYGIAADTGDSVSSNRIMNTDWAMWFNCHSTSISQNIINDSKVAFLDLVGSISTGNQVDNTDTISSPIHCH